MVAGTVIVVEVVAVVAAASLAPSEPWELAVAGERAELPFVGAPDFVVAGYT